MASHNFSLINKTKGTLPRVPFSRIKNEVLGKDYDLSLVFVDDEESREISLRTKNKDYVPNILSFELGDEAGEIFINPSEAARQAKDFGRTPRNMIAFLYIHGLCHLKGMDHGSRMERTEAVFRKKFGI
ncbi:MAG TPA: rRNA maturation RNase YbeY [Candidatus Paceibacterota bacterium]|nr:rRNA maturation RNase YbeY [Candidatus Paceibacterota bacterium]